MKAPSAEFEAVCHAHNEAQLDFFMIGQKVYVLMEHSNPVGRALRDRRDAVMWCREKPGIRTYSEVMIVADAK